MDVETLKSQIYRMNEDELFYKRYYYARQTPETLKAFLDGLDMEDVLRRKLVILEKKETVPLKYEDYFYGLTNEKSILAQKHNRYSPELVHSHTFFELLFVYEGKCQQKINHTTCNLQTGDICIIPPEIKHSVLVNDDSIIINVLLYKDSLHSDFYQFLNWQNILSSFFLDHIYSRKANDYIIFHTGNDYEIRRAFLYILWESINREVHFSQMIASTLHLVFGLLIRNYDKSVEMPSFARKSDEQRHAIQQYIQAHYNDVSLDDIAAKFQYSPEYTSSLIKEATGMTFTEIVQKIRIEQAEDMLKNTNMSISDIAIQIGYSSPEYFNRLFKKVHNMTPSAYRKMHAKNTNLIV